MVAHVHCCASVSPFVQNFGFELFISVFTRLRLFSYFLKTFIFCQSLSPFFFLLVSISEVSDILSCPCTRFGLSRRRICFCRFCLGDNLFRLEFCTRPVSIFKPILLSSTISWYLECLRHSLVHHTVAFTTLRRSNRLINFCFGMDSSRPTSSCKTVTLFTHRCLQVLL